MQQFNNLKYITYLLVFVFISIASSSCNRENTKNKKSVSYKKSLIKINKYLVKEDEERIRSYIKRKEWLMTQTESGLWYMIHETGDGELPKMNDVVILKFKVELLDGTLCYTSDSIGLKKFKIGYGNVESGLTEAVKLMQVGSKARFILPPYLAHGLVGDDYKIPGRAIIVYYVELLEIEN